MSEVLNMTALKIRNYIHFSFPFEFKSCRSDKYLRRFILDVTYFRFRRTKTCAIPVALVHRMVVLVHPPQQFALRVEKRKMYIRQAFIFPAISCRFSC
jgi:hypothetical protein